MNFDVILSNFRQILTKNGRFGTVRVGTGRSGRFLCQMGMRVGGLSPLPHTPPWFFQKNRILDFFEKCFKRVGTERVGRSVGRYGTGRYQANLVTGEFSNSIGGLYMYVYIGIHMAAGSRP